MKPLEYHIPVTRSDTLAVPLLTEASQLSANQIKQVMQKGAVWLTNENGTNRIRRARKKLSRGDTLHFYYDETVLKAEIPAPQLISDEDKYSVWYKPSGVLSQGSKWGDHCTINRWIETQDLKQRPSMIVHRLDRAARGLILIAHSKAVAQKLSLMFKNREIEKKYRALVSGCFSKDVNEVVVNTPINDKNACSRIRQIYYDSSQDQSLLEIHIESGRKHQIRKHLSESGFPILGDRLYGGGDNIDLQLAAVSLEFICPVTDIEKKFLLPENLHPSFGGI